MEQSTSTQTRLVVSAELADNITQAHGDLVDCASRGVPCLVIEEAAYDRVLDFLVNLAQRDENLSYEIEELLENL